MANSEQPHDNHTPPRVVPKSSNAERLPADIEAAWEAWIAGVGKVDERAKALLRAAFEVGVEAAKAGSENAADLGRRGGLKGGKARAAALSPAKRSAIAKKAAAK